MTADTQAALLEAIEGLLCFIASPKPDNGDRSKAIVGLVALREAVQMEDVKDS